MGYVVAVPFAALAVKRVKRVVKSRHVPTLALFSALCFLVMMFNVPIPDGTTAHAVGGAIVAIVLGPWAAMIAVGVALLFQALLFGDGGVLSFGVNVVNMAIVLPFAAYGIYRLLSGRSELTNPRRVLAAAVGGYIGINLAALATGIELGLQPLLFAAADGTPLYSPYSLGQAVPAMLFAHLVVAGFVEAVLTAGVIGYLQRANLPLLRLNHPRVPEEPAATPRKRVRPIAIAGIAVGIMVLLTPIGLLASGGAFGEDAPQDLNLSRLGLSSIPRGLQKYSDFWHHTLFPGYGLSEVPDWLAYIASAVAGILAVGILVYLIGKVVELFTRARAGGSTSGSAGSAGRATEGEDATGHAADSGDAASSTSGGAATGSS